MADGDHAVTRPSKGVDNVELRPVAEVLEARTSFRTTGSVRSFSDNVVHNAPNRLETGTCILWLHAHAVGRSGLLGMPMLKIPRLLISAMERHR